MGLPNTNNEEENVRKRSRKYRKCLADEFEVALWLVDALQVVTNLTLEAVERSREFRIDLAARLYLDQPYMRHVGPDEAYEGTVIPVWEAAQLCLLEASEDDTVECSRDLAAVTAAVDRMCPAGDDAQPAAPAAPPLAVNEDVGINRRGKGRPKKDPNAVKEPAKFGARNVSRVEYSAIMQEAGAELRELPKDQRMARASELSESLRRKHAGNVACARTLLRYAEDEDRSREKLGGRYFSDAFEADLAAVIRHYRSWKVFVGKDMVLAWAMQEVERAGLTLKLPELTKGWYSGFLRRQDLLTGSSRPLEITREKWTTSENVKAHYEVLEKLLLEEGIAEPNPDFDPLLPFSEPILILHPERLLSYDETAASLDETVGSKAKKRRGVRAGPDDGGQTVATRDSMHITAVGGRIGYKALPAMVMFGSGQAYERRWTLDPPVGNVLRGVKNTVVLPDGPPLESEVFALYHSNAKGSMTGEMCVEYTKRITIPSARVANPALANETGRRSVEVCDGVTVHLAAERLRLSREAGVHVVLRVPHSTHVTQGEDTVIFGPFKADYGLRKTQVMGELLLNPQAGKTQLGPEDFPACFKQPWERAFRREKIKQAWAKDGVIPFTRRCMWELRAEEERRATAAAALTAREQGAAELRGLRATPMSGRRMGPPSRGDGEDDDDERADMDDDDERADVEGRGIPIAEAGTRGQTAAPSIRKAVDRFTPSQDQEALSQLSQASLLRKAKRMRDNQDVARHALLDEDDKRKQLRDGKMCAKAGALWNKGPVTSDASLAIVEAATREREEADAAKHDRKRAKAIKGKEQAQMNGELTDNALGEIRRGEAKFPDAFSNDVLKAIAAHLCPDLKLGQTREVIIRDLGVPPAVEDAIETARAKTEANDKAMRRRRAAVSGGVNDRALPEAAPPVMRTCVSRGGRGRGKAPRDVSDPKEAKRAGAQGSGAGRGRGRSGDGFHPVRRDGPRGASGGPRRGGR